MSVISMMSVRVSADRRTQAIAAFEERRVLPECAEAIDGFLRGEMLSSIDDAHGLCVIAHWRDLAAYEAWLAHPWRLQQAQDLGHYLLGPPVNTVFQTALVHPRLGDTQPAACTTGSPQASGLTMRCDGDD